MVGCKAKEWLKCIKDYDGEVHPKLRIFKNCTNLIRCLPLLQYDAKIQMIHQQNRMKLLI